MYLTTENAEVTERNLEAKGQRCGFSGFALTRLHSDPCLSLWSPCPLW